MVEPWKPRLVSSGLVEQEQASSECFLEQNEKEKDSVTYDIGLTCDIIDESFYKPIVVALTNPSCSTFTSTL